MSDSDLHAKLESLDKLVRLLKVGVGAIIAVAIWATTVQLGLSSQQKQLDRISISSEIVSGWRTTKEMTDAKQDTLIANIATIQATQQQQINGILTREPVNAVRAER